MTYDQSGLREKRWCSPEFGFPRNPFGALTREPASLQTVAERSVRFRAEQAEVTSFGDR